MSWSSAHCTAGSALDTARGAADAARSAVEACEKQLKAAEQAPAPVIQPLPKIQSKALQWLFFLNMPPLFRKLSRASFLAQQQLLPTVDSTFAKAITWPASGQFHTQPFNHYNSHQRCTYHTPAQQRQACEPHGHVLLRSSHKVPAPKDIGPSHVDYMSRGDGVWYPDRLSLDVAWSGSGCQVESWPSTYFNPFAAFKSQLTVLHFTEQLDSNSSAFQWAVPLFGSTSATSPDRGNLGIACQHLRPAERFSKPGWLDFTRLRAYPLRQLEQLACALHERTLPLADLAVATVLKSTLFHLGELQAEGLK